MDQALRPHRGGTVLALGILSLLVGLFLIPLGIVAWIIGSRDLKGMKRGEVDSAGRSLTQIGWVFGIASCVIWLVSAACALLVFSVVPVGQAMMYSSDSDHPHVRTVETHYENTRHFYDDSNLKETWQEVQLADGNWVKEGVYVRRSPTRAELEGGSYRNGKREGMWVFRNEDGSIDFARSGIYEDDVRVQAGATPPGDYTSDDGVNR